MAEAVNKFIEDYGQKDNENSNDYLKRVDNFNKQYDSLDEDNKILNDFDKNKFNDRLSKLDGKNDDVKKIREKVDTLFKTTGSYNSDFLELGKMISDLKKDLVGKNADNKAIDKTNEVFKNKKSGKMIEEVLKTERFKEDEDFSKISKGFAELNAKNAKPMEYLSFIMSNLGDVVSMVFDKLWGSFSGGKLEAGFTHLSEMEKKINALDGTKDKKELENMKSDFEDKIKNIEKDGGTVNDEADLAYLLGRVKDKLNHAEGIEGLKKEVKKGDILTFNGYQLKGEEKKSNDSSWFSTDGIQKNISSISSDFSIKNAMGYISKSFTQEKGSPWLHSAVVSEAGPPIKITHADQPSGKVVEMDLSKYLDRFSAIDIAVSSGDEDVAKHAKEFIGKPYSEIKMVGSGGTGISPDSDLFKMENDKGGMFCSEMVLKSLIKSGKIKKEDIKSGWDPKEIFKYTQAKYATSLKFEAKKEKK